MASLRHEQREGVVILTVTEPAGGLTADLLNALKEQLDQAARRADVTGVVLVLRGGHGVSPKIAAVLSDACLRVESLNKPVIAALEGTVGGALWALALAAHFRFAASDTQIFMPEARMGYLPGGGITQRLPRLTGAANAIKLMLSTRPEVVAELLALGAVDRIFETDPVAEAVAAIQAGLAPRPTCRQTKGMRDGTAYLTEVQAFKDRVSGDPLDVTRTVVKVVEAALLLPFAQGLAFEAVTLEDLAAAPETRAVAHANQVDRVVRERLRALAVHVKGSGAQVVRRFGLWCPGPERAELVVAGLTRGLSVVIADPDREAQVALRKRVSELQEFLVAQKSLSPEARDADWARLSYAEGPEGLHDCDLILLAQPDFPREDKALPLIALGHDPTDPDPLPALMPALYAKGHAEISLPATYLRRAVAQSMDLASKLGWRLQRVGPRGFIAHRLRKTARGLPIRMIEAGFSSGDIAQGMAAAGLGTLPAGKRAEPTGAAYDISHLVMAAMANEAARILGEGIGLSSAEVDAAATASGLMPRWKGGPLYQADLRGLILLRADLQRLAGDEPADIAPLIEQLIHEGRRFFNSGP